MNSDHYILIGRDPVPVSADQLLTWGMWFGMACRGVARDVFPVRKPLKKGHPRMRRRLNHFRAQEVVVSTVFLGLDHNYWGGEPLLFESLVFGGYRDGYMLRYSTWAQAEQGHDFIVTNLVKGNNED